MDIRFFAIIVIFIGVSAQAQNPRITNKNSIGWYSYFGTFKLNKKFSAHTEYQFRRNNIISDKFQSLLRVGVNYQAHPAIQLRFGYAWVETYPYGDIPINAQGKDFTEHRLFQMATFTNKISRVDLSHRFMLEQRWIGRYTRPELTKEDEFIFLNRARYMFRFQIPFKGKEIVDKSAYIAAYDEIFIGFGKNVNENVFDQNRYGALLGYKFNKSLRVEAGYINQTLQLGREVNNRNVFQKNNGLLVNLNFNIDAQRKSKAD